MALADLEKPIPVKFDYATFRYYLELDVLQDTARFLDWFDINKALGGTTRTTIVVGNILDGSDKITFTAPTTVPILPGSKFYYTEADFLEVISPTAIGGTEAYIDPDDAPTEDLEVTYTLVQTNIPYRSVQHIYDGITDEVLLRMGYTDPLQVPTERIREMMLLGRVEAWRRVVQNTVTDVDINYELETTEVLVLTRSQMHIDSIRQWVIAQADYAAEFPLSANNLNYTTPEVRTYAGAVKARW